MAGVIVGIILGIGLSFVGHAVAQWGGSDSGSAILREQRRQLERMQDQQERQNQVDQLDRSIRRPCP